MSDKLTLPDLLKSLGVKLDVVYLGYQAEADVPQDKRWPHFLWHVTVSLGQKSHSTDYRAGVGHAKKGTAIPPKAADVVYCLISDAQNGRETFEDFCSNYGYDTDSRKTLDTYLACQVAYSACWRLFGEHYQAVCEAAQDY